MSERKNFETEMVLEALNSGSMMRKINELSFQKSMVFDSLKDLDVKKIKRIILSGCGDSYASGVSAKEAFEELTGLPCEAPSSVEMSRYMYPQMFEDSLVVINSISGGVSRVIEDTMRANKHGAFTLALTGNKESKLALTCAASLVMAPMPERDPKKSSPKVIAYTASTCGLLHIAISLGEMMGRYDESTGNKYRKDLFDYSSDSFEKASDLIGDQTFAVAKSWKDMSEYAYLGDGSEYGATIFGAFKWPESMGRPATWDDTENWNHVNYFQKDIESVGTAVVVRRGSPSMSRVKETVEALCNLGRSVAVVTDDDAAVFDKKAMVCTIPNAPYSWMAPCFLHIPLSLFASYVHAQINPEFIPYRNKGGIWEDPGASRLTQSKIVEI